MQTGLKNKQEIFSLIEGSVLFDSKESLTDVKYALQTSIGNEWDNVVCESCVGWEEQSIYQKFHKENMLAFTIKLETSSANRLSSEQSEVVFELAKEVVRAAPSLVNKKTNYENESILMHLSRYYISEVGIFVDAVDGEDGIDPEFMAAKIGDIKFISRLMDLLISNGARLDDLEREALRNDLGAVAADKGLAKASGVLNQHLRAVAMVEKGLYERIMRQ